jgi:two-component system, OmpR family, phosphate regulon sensor histidine kinase PhoR
MRRKRLIWRLYPAIFLPSAVMLAAVMWYSSRSIHQFYFNVAAEDLEARVKLVAPDIAFRIAANDYAGADSLCKALGHPSRTRITVVLGSGVVIGDSEEDPAGMQNHSDRPEIAAAMGGRTGRAVRYSSTLRHKMLYVALPLESRGGVTAVVRAAVPLRSVDRALGGIYRHIVVGVLVLAAAAAIASFVISRRIARPLEELKNGAERYAEGDFQAALPVADSEEVGALVNALKKMAARLDERLAKVVQQRSEQETILASMVESVVAIDTNKKVIGLNHAAADLFGVDAAKAQGKPLPEVIRNPEIQTLAAGALSSDRPVEGEITMYGAEERVLQAHGSALKDAAGLKIGVLLVLYDITRLRRLERVRRDFVANVSHELKTPITAIKGFVETLSGGAIDQKDDAARFLKIVEKHVERLDSIIEDLLTLSRLEQDTESAETVLENKPVGDVLISAVEVCRPVARSRSIEIRLNAEERVVCDINTRLLEQAVVNLIDNAIKYSDPGSSVDVSLRRAGSEAVISVEDRGCGIERQHLPRLFERFYRTDRARSRDLGGTGLGLAIVKHIALVHRGRVEVESEPGEGSVFSLFLPT